MESLVEWSNLLIRAAGIPGVFFVSLMSASSLFFFPIADIVYIPWSVGVGLGPAQVGLAAGAGSALGELVGYGIGRLSRNFESLRKSMTRTRKGIPRHTLYFVWGRWIMSHTDPKEWTSTYGFWAIPIFAFTPLPMDLLGIALGYLKYNPFMFLAGTFIGKLPRCLLLAYGLRLFRVPVWSLLAGGAALAAIVVASRLIKA